MAWLSGDTVVIAQLTAVGGLVMGAVWYRLHVWHHRRETVIRAMTASVAVFGSFGLGVVLALLSGSGPAVRLEISGFALIGGPPLALLAYQFWQGRPVSPYLLRAALLLVIWAFLFGWGSGDGMGRVPQTLALGIGLVSFCMVVGLVNGLLGPLVPVMLIAHALSAALGSSAGWLDLPFTALVELLIGHFPDPLRLLAGLLITVLGLAEFFAFFGVKVTTALDNLYGWAAT